MQSIDERVSARVIQQYQQALADAQLNQAIATARVEILEEELAVIRDQVQALTEQAEGVSSDGDGDGNTD